MTSSSTSTSAGNNKDTQQHHLYVLYGSQTGNSEQAAEDFCRQLRQKYKINKDNDNSNNDDDDHNTSSSFWKQHNLPECNVTTTCIQLDDFLELKQAQFDGRCIVIFVSSYGVGQAPLGAYRFRSLADALILLKKTMDDEKQPSTSSSLTNTGIYNGLYYAVCGLGDSTYPTYLKNPTTIDRALEAAGATRMQPLGKADAHQMGEQAQDKVIQRWIDDLWLPLAKALTTPPPPPTTTTNDNDKKGVMDAKEMQRQTLQLLKRLDPDFKITASVGDNNNNNNLNGTTILIAMAILVAIVAVLLGTGVIPLPTSTSPS
ncbi:flavodoxin [Nitzschia inconspicua]|uniref:Flavodoxin n=1 Tax=Nitzschia inconspicua TaxID=303405 RepID=A0A9K3KK42_9STRA|nr:flavodoxin [Nitzschia inconspicua]